MANMVDYLAWRGDIPFEAAPWNEIDALLIATLSYLNFHGGKDPKGWTLEEMARINLLQEGTTNSFIGRKKAFEGMASGARFRDCRLHHAIALTDEMEERGIVAAKDGSKPRKCLITREEWEEMKRSTEGMS